ncbi:hypothetical protein [Bartonella phoceensis]|uniref:hypothetical protein n=1 Tax=Bartonella phoceensis TaxID=270249 RepID=UPI001ABB8935|nr:hypothetical protein [Bartonella phoceensis]
MKEPPSADNNMINELINLLYHHADIIDGLSPELLANNSGDFNRRILLYHFFGDKHFSTLIFCGKYF